jgi:hypothetical protein
MLRYAPIKQLLEIKEGRFIKYGRKESLFNNGPGTIVDPLCH